MNAISDYHDFYLKTDFLGFFEKFIPTCLDYFGLDPCIISVVQD